MLPQRYVPKKISGVKENDSRVSITGKVVSSKDNVLVVEDSTGKKEITSEKNVEAGSVVRVFCSNIDGKLKADVVQSLSGLDMNLYQKVEELYRKAKL